MENYIRHCKLPTACNLRVSYWHLASRLEHPWWHCCQSYCVFSPLRPFAFE